MSTFTTQPFSPLNYSQILKVLVTHMSAGSGINDANIGSVIRTFFESVAMVVDNANVQMTNVLNAFYINSATGTDLDKRGTDFEVPRKLNASSTVTLYFSGTYGTVIPPGTICGTTVTFLTQYAGLTNTPITAICLTTGSIGNVAANTITTIQNNPNNSLITGVNNPEASVGGFDLESDPAYRARIIDYLSSLSQGTDTAISSALVNIPNAGITQVEVLEIDLDPAVNSLGYSLSFTPPYTNANTDIQGTSYGMSQTTCDYATTAALPTNTYNNGTLGVGATLVATSNGLLTVDGVAMSLNKRVLVSQEATNSNNGVYVIQDPGSVGTKFAMVRANDLNIDVEFPNYFTSIASGNTLAGNTYLQITVSPFIVGTSSAVFSLVQNVRLATTAPLFPTYSYYNGVAGVGATLTATGVGVLVIDGMAVNLNDRVVVQNEIGGNLPYNGVYSMTTLGTVSVPYVLTRVTDMNTPSSFINYVATTSGGDTLINKTFIQMTNPFTSVGTNNVVFNEVSAILASLITNTPGSIVVVIDNGYGSLPFSAVGSALEVVNGVSGNTTTYPGVVSAGIQAFVSRPSLYKQDITLTVVTDTTSILDPAQVSQNVLAALTAYFTTVPIGGTIYRSEIIDVAMNVSGVIDVPEAAFTTPASNVSVGLATRAIPGVISINY